MGNTAFDFFQKSPSMNDLFLNYQWPPTKISIFMNGTINQRVCGILIAVGDFPRRIAVQLEV